MIDGTEPCGKKTREKLGRVRSDDGRGAEAYVDYLVSAAETEIKGLRVIVDCANGAASKTAARLFSAFDLDFELLHDHPNGININDGCGSTHMEHLRSMVKAGGFDLGLAFDGDADRCLAVDERGEIGYWSRMMAVIGRHMKDAGRLKNDSIGATVMSNVGFHEFAGKNGIELHCSAVGDRNVLELMLGRGCNIGGEQSGHIIFLDDATTGDGQLAAVKFLSVVCLSGKKVSELVADVPQYPQVLKNLPVPGNGAKTAIMESAALREAVRREETRLAGAGRILIRPSGTESLIRVMVEAKTEETAAEVADQLISLIQTLH
jgi:phosphoglucosamine mutase